MSADPLDLATLADVEAFLVMPPGNPDEVVLQTLITNISGIARSYLSRERLGYVATIVETLNGNNKDRIYTRRFPIVSVASVVVDNFSIPASSSPTQYGFTFDSDDDSSPNACRAVYLQSGSSQVPVGTPPSPPFTNPPYFYKGVRNVVITYAAGYWLPNTVGTQGSVPSLPLAIRQAVIETVALRYRQTKRWGDASVGEGQERITYITSALPDSAKMALNPYRDVVLGY